MRLTVSFVSFMCGCLVLTSFCSCRVFKFSVENIDLRGESSVDAEWMAYIGAFHCLRSLILADCHRITSSALWPIIGMHSLGLVLKLMLLDDLLFPVVQFTSPFLKQMSIYDCC